MKVNDKVPVVIAGQVVAQATVRELGDGTATLVVPATLVVMATRTELTVEGPSEDTTGTETIITGVDRASGESAAVEVTPPTVQETPAVETTVQNDSVSQDTVPVSEPVTEPVTPVETVQPAGETAPESSGNASD